MMQKNTITVTSDKITQPLTFAFAADFHNGDADEALSLMRGCDAILIGGDLVNRHSRHGWRNAARFLDLAPRVAPRSTTSATTSGCCPTSRNTFLWCRKAM